jgi:hypothetical protein
MEFDIPRNIIIVGKKNSGKTNLVKHLIVSHRDHFNFGLVFTNTKFDDDYNYIPEKYIIQGFREDVFRHYRKELEKMKKKTGVIPPNFIIFDDLVGILKENQKFINFIANHRHYNTSLFISAQYLKKGVPTTLRDNIDYAVIFRATTKNSILGFYESFGQEIGSYEEFKQFLLDITREKYETLVYNATETELDNIYIKYKAPDVLKMIIHLDY